MAALRSFAFSLSSGRSFCDADLVVQAEDRGADQLERSRASAARRCSGTGRRLRGLRLRLLGRGVGLLDRLSPSAIFAITGLAFFLLLASAAGAATSRPAEMAATGRIRVMNVRAGTAATSVSIACVGSVCDSDRPDAPFRGTFPSVARLAQRAPWLCAPSSRTVCPYREVRTCCCPCHRQRRRNLHSTSG